MEKGLNKLYSTLADVCGVHLYDITESTNKDATEYARSGEYGGGYEIFVADGQTGGRGRLGRSFLSPRGEGIYLSILRGESGETDPTAITVYTAVILSRVIERMTGLTPTIKWVNDIYVGGKKLAGILVQGVVDEGKIVASVTGIGINVGAKRLAPEIENIATSLAIEYERQGYGEPPTREDIITAIVREFIASSPQIGRAEIAEEYKRRSFLIGKRVNVITPTVTYPATVLDIDPECRLVIKGDDGGITHLSTGDVSVREAK